MGVRGKKNKYWEFMPGDGVKPVKVTVIKMIPLIPDLPPPPEPWPGKYGKSLLKSQRGL
jgi:hypothetical protein